MSKVEVADIVRQAVEQLYKIKINPEINYPEARFGDFSTNVAYILASQLKKSPQSLANELKTAIQHDDIDQVEAVDGYLNLSMTDGYWLRALESSSQPQAKVQRIVVEYGHPNTHKFPHIGHLFSYVAGDAIARILAAAGHEVRKVNYQGDIGLHVAKCLYVWRQQDKPTAESILDRMAILQRCYQDGSKLYDQSESDKAAIEQLNADLYSRTGELKKDWQQTRDWSLEYLTKLEQQLDVNQVEHYFESEVAQEGLEQVKSKVGTVFEKSDGAVIFPGEKHDLHNRVFINSQGLPTYEAKELGLNLQKYQDWQFDLTIIPTAREQNDYFSVVIEAINGAIPELKGKMKHVGFGFVDLASGKMSSRSGNIMTAQELIDASLTSATVVAGQLDELTESEQTDIANAVAIGAIKYGFLKSSLGKNISFDLERDLTLNGNSGPYVQYAHARASRILSKASGQKASNTAKVQLGSEERAILRHISKWPETLEQAASELAPHLITNFLYQLAETFNRWYEKQRIIGSDQEELRLKIVERVKQSLAEGLDLLGISAPEKM